MWPRVVEIMFGWWLAVSPFIFRHGDDPWLWWSDGVCAALAVTFGLLSYWKPTRQMHLGTLLVGGWLVCSGMISSPYPAPPGYQNHVLVGFLLMMFAIIPNNSLNPPPEWRTDLNKETQSPRSRSH